MKKTVLLLLFLSAAGVRASESEVQDTVRMREVVIDDRHEYGEAQNLPQTVISPWHEVLTEEHQPSVMPTLSRLVPGLFVPSRGMMGYGVNSGGAGGIVVRGLSSGVGQMLVLIDGEPQYSGIYGRSLIFCGRFDKTNGRESCAMRFQRMDTQWL